ncbi:hypothetical protein HanXRQr2_Chr02g0052131 [Helianthus annuus]|uniref:Uncharacterized protein n=1 Tax=Helianthus annuus TaxID=4232 RepID=A0A9K3JKX1_HELAN|nr:hypothetical protein HanXRQr2_Chr02g0052131 [Helianthus annuus]
MSTSEAVGFERTRQNQSKTSVDACFLHFSADQFLRLNRSVESRNRPRFCSHCYIIVLISINHLPRHCKPQDFFHY